jgi:hypothetical protein
MAWRVVEDVSECALNDVQRCLRRVNGNLGAMLQIVRADVIEAEDVVGVPVRENDGVETLQIRSEHLLAEIRTGINHYSAARVLQQYRRAQAAVMRVGRVADGARAADRGHAHGCAGAEDGQPETWHGIQGLRPAFSRMALAAALVTSMKASFSLPMTSVRS